MTFKDASTAAHECVYKIICSKNGFSYIGCSMDFKTRILGHYYSLRSNKHKTSDYGNTLQGFRNGREENDEKHICPLQLDTIERLIHLYSNKGDTVFTPFMGIGSEAFQAVKMGRKAVGFELKESYFDVAKKNIASAVALKSQLSII